MDGWLGSLVVLAILPGADVSPKLSQEAFDPAGPRLLERLHLVDKNSEDMQNYLKQ